MGHNPIQFSHELDSNRGQEGPTSITLGTKQPHYTNELDLMGQNVPIELGNQTRYHLGAIPKQMAIPRELLSNSTEEISYTNIEGDPRPAQHALLQQCLMSSP